MVGKRAATGTAAPRKFRKGRGRSGGSITTRLLDVASWRGDDGTGLWGGTVPTPSLCRSFEKNRLTVTKAGFCFAKQESWPILLPSVRRIVECAKVIQYKQANETIQ